MTKRKLDLSHTLEPLNHELYDTLCELLALKEKDSPLFNAAIESFVHKYGSTPFTSLDELIENSAANASYSCSKPLSSLDDMLKDLLP